jgi:hypothetical protein
MAAVHPRQENLGIPGPLPACPMQTIGEVAMKDLLFTLVVVGFFAASWLYAKACERL